MNKDIARLLQKGDVAAQLFPLTLLGPRTQFYIKATTFFFDFVAVSEFSKDEVLSIVAAGSFSEDVDADVAASVEVPAESFAGADAIAATAALAVVAVLNCDNIEGDFILSLAVTNGSKFSLVAALASMVAVAVVLVFLRDLSSSLVTE